MCILIDGGKQDKDKDKNNKYNNFIHLIESVFHCIGQDPYQFSVKASPILSIV